MIFFKYILSFIKMNILNDSKIGNVKNVIKLIQDGIDINEVDKHGSSPLILSVQRGYTKIVSRLLIARANTEIKDNSHKTALMYATESGNVCIASMIVSAKANVNAVTDFGETALMMASKEGHIDCVELLLKSKADVNNVDTHDQSALLFCSKSKKTNTFKCLKLLLEYKADISIKNNLSLRQTAYSGSIDKMLLLIENKANVDDTGIDFTTPLMMASSKGHIRCIEALIQHKANVNKCTHNFETALMAAVSHKQNNCISVLVNNGCDINARTKDGVTALMMAAASKNNTVCTEELLANGATIDSEHNILLYASSENKKVLIKHIQTSIYDILIDLDLPLPTSGYHNQLHRDISEYVI